MQLSLHIRQLQLVPCKDALREIPDGKVLINTVNAWSFVCAQEDPEFARALLRSDYLLPDGISMVKACKWLRYEPRPRERIAGADLFAFEMERLNARGGVCFFMGSSPQVLRRITERAAKDYPRIREHSGSEGRSDQPFRAVRRTGTGDCRYAPAYADRSGTG